jgi:hypothetical protein
MSIDTKKLTNIVLDCLYKSEETPNNLPPADAVIVKGVVRNFGFHPTRLESHRADVINMLNELPPQFHQKTGGGWSFLNACMTKDGHQWGEQLDVEALMCLGIGLKLVRYPLPREMWNVLPGSVPYFVIDIPQSGDNNAD